MALQPSQAPWKRGATAMPLQVTSNKGIRVGFGKGSGTASGKVTGTVIVAGAGEWYGTLIVDKIQYDNGSPVTIQNFLGVKFKSPQTRPPGTPITVTVAVVPYQQVSAEIAYEDIDAATLDVTAKLVFPESHTFRPTDKLTWEIAGNLTDAPDKYTGSFEFFVDSLPSGIVQLTCALAPIRDLAQSFQTVQLKQGSGQPTQISIVPGQTELHSVYSGTYALTADDLTNELQTLVAPATVLPGQITVLTGETANIEVRYSGVTRYSALDVYIGQLAPPLDQEKLRITVVDQASGTTLADFRSLHNSKTDLRRLQVSGTAVITAEITLNNVKYFAVKTTELANQLIEVFIEQNDFQTRNEDTSGFVTLPVVVDTDLTQPSKTISVRLTSTTTAMIYTQDFTVRAGPTRFDLKIALGEYEVLAKGFFDGSIVYAIVAPATLTVSASPTALTLRTRRGTDLNVHGFPNILGFGALSNLSPNSDRGFVAARASSVFKYAGTDGAGDSERYLEDDNDTRATVQLAHSIESQIGNGHQVLPVMISYTVNLSLGDIITRLRGEEWLKHSFGNLILSLNIAVETAQQYGKQACPAGYVVNADFLGECQKGPEGTRLEPEFEMPVIAPLKAALEYRGVPGNFPEDFPSQIKDTLKGYVFAVNWLIRKIAENVTFGWQVNVWGVGNSTWVYSRDPTLNPAEMARRTADYIKELEVYNHASPYKPNFVAIDRYEADDFTLRAYSNSYCYGPYEWARFYDFCSALSLELQVPAMPWQIPASRIPNKNESVVNLEVEQWGSGGTYLFSDELINGDIRNIHPTILGIKQTSLVPHDNVESIFKSAEPFDLSLPGYLDFLYRGIFTVLLGGGATTGIQDGIGTTGPWTQEKMREYMANPIPIPTSIQNGSTPPSKNPPTSEDPYCPRCNQLLPEFADW